MKDQWKKWREKMLSLWQGKTGKAAAGLAFAAVACLGLFVVLPSLAEEGGSHDGVEIINVTETPEASETPTAEETEEPEPETETEEPVITKEPEATPAETEKAEKAEDKAEVSQTPEAETTPETKKNETSQWQSETIKKRAATNQPAKQSAVAEPVIKTQPQDLQVDYKAIDSTTKLSVETEAVDSDVILSYQWYCDGEKISGPAAKEREFIVDEDLNAGKYDYYCQVTATDAEDENNQASVKSSHATVTVNKIAPSKDQFVYKIENQYYYTAEALAIDISVKSGIEGMGSVRISTWKGGQQTSFLTPGTYDLRITVSEGTNYKKDEFPLTETATIKQITPSVSYSIQGVKGNKVDGMQWYTGNVSLKAPSGYKIAAEETGDYQDAIVCDTESTTSQIDVAPEEVYLKQTSTGAVTKPYSVDAFAIDKTDPTGTFSVDTDTWSAALNQLTFGRFFKDTVTVTLNASDPQSESDQLKCYLLVSAGEKGIPAANLPKQSWGSERTSVNVSDAAKFVVYGKIVDVSGRTVYVSSDGIVIDSESPVITCEGKTLQDTYIADEKTFEVADDNLDSISYQPQGGTKQTIKDKDTFTLTSPSQTGASTQYEVSAVDRAGNETKVTITMVNPVDDFDVKAMDFGTVTYGYDNSSQEQAMNIVLNAKYNVDYQPKIVSVEPIVQDEKSYFETVLQEDGSYKIRPVAGLHTGTYTQQIRVNYEGERAQSTTKFSCTMTVDRATLMAAYEGHQVYYNTIPDFTDHVKVTGFVNGDTQESLMTSEKDAFSEALKVAFTGRATREAYYDLAPAGGTLKDYKIQAATGTLTVVRRDAAKGKEYKLQGTEGNNDWYTSNVSIQAGAAGKEAAQGYLISTSENPDSFAETIYSPDDWQKETTVSGSAVSFYIMNKETGEIFNQSTETVKIDKTAPYLAEGQGMKIASSLWREFLNGITFNKFFNDTIAVEITGSDALSGLDEDGIQYYVSSKALTQSQLQKVAWESGSSFNLEPKTLDRSVVYAKITDRAGLSLFISSDGMVFDNKVPDIEVVTDGEEYITEEKEITISDVNLTAATLYEGTDTTVSGTAITVEGQEAKITIPCPDQGSKEYTIIAKDGGGNVSEKSFTITKPIYDITADRVKLKNLVYGFGTAPGQLVTWKNTEEANADATVSEVVVKDTGHFAVKEDNGRFYIQAAKGIDAGSYVTNVYVKYNHGKVAETTASLTVDKAVLTAHYTGQNVYYHETPDFVNTVEVKGFVNGETAETAAGYKAPEVTMKGKAVETCVLEPSGREADNYRFTYTKGVLIVNRRDAEAGSDGQYQVKGARSDTGWYLSDITIQPASGCAISLDEDGKDPQERLVLTKNTDAGVANFYLTDEKTGEVYKEVAFDYRKDSDAPQFTNVKDGDTYTVNSREITVKDDYLASVTVNGVAQEVVDNETSTFALSADEVSKLFVIVATDYAGNVSKCSVVLKQPAQIEDQEDSKAQTTSEPADKTLDSSQTTGSTTKKTVKIVQGAPQTVLSTNAKDLTTSVLTEAEQRAAAQGSDVNVELKVQNIDNSVPQMDKELIISNLNGYSVGRYMDITLWKTVGSGSAKKVTETKSPLAVTISIPEELRKTSDTVERSFVIFRVHGTKVIMLKDQDAVKNTITFKTDQFSTYALAYKDVVKESSQNTSVSSTSGTSKSSSTADSQTGEETGTGSDTSPSTGDAAPILVMILLFAVAAVATAVIVYLKLRKKTK